MLNVAGFVIVSICVCRGEVISKAGPEEAVIYADIGKRGSSLLISADSIDQETLNYRTEWLLLPP